MVTFNVIIGDIYVGNLLYILRTIYIIIIFLITNLSNLKHWGRIDKADTLNVYNNLIIVSLTRSL